MYSPLAEDHATQGWMAECLLDIGIMLDILHLSQRSVHSGTKKSSFVLSFLLAVLLWSQQTCPRIHISHPCHWETAAFLLEPVVFSAASFCLFVHSSVDTVCICSSVSVCFTVLFLCMSPQWPWVSLWASVRGRGSNGGMGGITNTL